MHCQVNQLALQTYNKKVQGPVVQGPVWQKKKKKKLTQDQDWWWEIASCYGK